MEIQETFSNPERYYPMILQLPFSLCPWQLFPLSPNYNSTLSGERLDSMMVCHYGSLAFLSPCMLRKAYAATCLASAAESVLDAQKCWCWPQTERQRHNVYTRSSDSAECCKGLDLSLSNDSKRNLASTNCKKILFTSLLLCNKHLRI